MGGRRKQGEFPGMGRKKIAAIEEAADEYIAVRDKRAELSKKESIARATLLATMKAHGVKVYKWDDAEGEELEAVIDEEPRVKVQKTGDADSPVGEGLPEHEGASANAPHPGLIAEAERSMQANGFSVTADGDVVPPESNGARKTKGKRKKPS